MTTLLLASDWLISEINAHGDKWVPASPENLEFLGDTIRVMVECEEDPLRVEPSTLQYTDVIGVLRGIQTKMSWEGYVEREAEIQDSGVEDLFGTVAVTALSGEDGPRDTD